jgi:hypothetical protein
MFIWSGTRQSGDEQGPTATLEHPTRTGPSISAVVWVFFLAAGLLRNMGLMQKLTDAAQERLGRQRVRKSHPPSIEASPPRHEAASIARRGSTVSPWSHPRYWQDFGSRRTTITTTRSRVNSAWSPPKTEATSPFRIAGARHTLMGDISPTPYFATGRVYE